MTPTRAYKNDKITVEWWADRCTKCKNCHQSLPQAFNPKARPWVNINGASAEEITAVCAQCPSEAIVALEVTQ